MRVRGVCACAVFGIVIDTWPLLIRRVKGKNVDGSGLLRVPRTI
jgi:hypothetical protein